MSCSGKTTFANLLTEHDYICFDAHFHWHLVETFGFSASINLCHVAGLCSSDRYVLDGWHLSDVAGSHLPKNSCVYVIYASYEQIIEQYRIPVFCHDEFREMYEKWYRKINYPSLPGVRYFHNDGCFAETSRRRFLATVGLDR